MSVDIHFTSTPDLEVNVNHFTDRDDPWCSVSIGNGEGRVKIFMTDAQLRDLVRHIEIELSQSVPLCYYDDCLEDATTTLELTVLPNGERVNYDYCAEHAKDVALTSYRRHTASLITLRPI